MKSDSDIQHSSTSALSVHIAEYEALTMRNTYWLTLEYALGPILLLTLALIVQVEPNLGQSMAI